MIPKPESYSVETSSLNQKTLGQVNHILSQSFVDGPGNRVVIFLQGCNFHCVYCHNPFTINLCTSCGVCVPGCPSGALRVADMRVLWDESICTGCDSCVKTCPYHSSPKTKSYTPDELWQEIRPSATFISGISVSGGEPSLQLGFLVKFFRTIKSNSVLTTLIETNGYAGSRAYDPLIPFLDMALVDLKIMDSQKHVQLTGHRNSRVLETIRHLHAKGKLQGVNEVIVPGFHTENDVIQTAQFLVRIDPSIPLHLLKFRSHGTAGKALEWESPPDDKMNQFVSLTQEQGLKHVTRSL